MKTSELNGTALDWAVAKCEGVSMDPRTRKSAWISYSSDWAQGGPIIERECITVEHAGVWVGRCWKASDGDEQIEIEGATPLIAAMRCYVTSNLGDEVALPEGVAL
jgi:hypothetical protein